MEMWMDTEQALTKATEVLAPWAAPTPTAAAERLDFTVSGDSLLDAIAALRANHWGYLSAITGLDLGVEAGELEVLYHFCDEAAIVTLRVRTPRDAAKVPSVCGMIPSASLFEREIIEMLGIDMVGTPVRDHLFLPDGWPEGVYPLRKDFSIAQAPTPAQA
jgi:Ni,Fe-hydrogenase III component G